MIGLFIETPSSISTALAGVADTRVTSVPITTHQFASDFWRTDDTLLQHLLFMFLCRCLASFKTLFMADCLFLKVCSVFEDAMFGEVIAAPTKANTFNINKCSPKCGRDTRNWYSAHRAFTFISFSKLYCSLFSGELNLSCVKLIFYCSHRNGSIQSHRLNKTNLILRNVKIV